MKVSMFRLMSWLAVAVIALAACSNATTGDSAKLPMPTGEVSRGAQIFAETCSACHGPDGKGKPGLGKNLVASTFVKGLTDQELFDFLHVGRPSYDKMNTTGVDMPPRGGNPYLTEQDLAGVVAYLRTINNP